jgi:hypothetical protein
LQLLIENVDLYFLDDRATPLLLFHTHYPLGKPQAAASGHGICNT